MNESALLTSQRSYLPFGFPLSRRSWDLFEVKPLIESLAPTWSSSEGHAVRKLADRFNRRRFKEFRPGELIQAGELMTVGVIVDVLRYILVVYNHRDNAGVMSRGVAEVASHLGTSVVDRPPTAFVNLFPPLPVMLEKVPEKDFLKAASKDISNFDKVTAELILLSLSMENPAFKPFRDLFHDRDLCDAAPYRSMIGGLERFYKNQPDFDPLNLPLFEAMRLPMRECPDSVEDQLRFILKHWASFLPLELVRRLTLASDILKEETQLRGLGGGPNLVMEFTREVDDAGYPEPARFSRDADWMSNVVIIAKTAYVWLDQLSKKYKRDIRILSDVPDEELDRLARWGFTGLWLIGLWERSAASEKIKKMMGNPEAAASAYSLYDYDIAAELGGEEAYQNLRARAWDRGIRLASDMVPNHMGIYSRWVIEHPNWFVQDDHPPFPNYAFTGEDLSWDDRVVLQIEDGYWEHRDAAVVFKRIDKHTGDVKYIYHGNDGTSMPWNDTAQLNFMMSEVREAVIQTILHVARKFPIIRFDAAMTLAKKHYQRLWFPKPGDAGAIPSRAEHSMTRAQFDEAFPAEFWRNVVDRVAAEVPDTLLLAEAFWLMEGYFVRTLGMHRVYNSAFMNMLKMEDNCKYRLTIKNVLRFSPEVLKRFVNFMNNPDEDTAIAQFGDGDKYFGVAMLMVTMPGLPMFGHGQIEGLTEKYGMEYRKAYWDEQTNEGLVTRHEREIFPLMRRRELFSGAENFAFFDFMTPDGWVDENVYAYTNRCGDQRAVILFNNAYETTRGQIHTSTPINVASDEDEFIVTRTLAEALGLNTSCGHFYKFSDHHAGLEFIRGGQQIADDGLFAELGGYQYHAFMDFREIFDFDGSWGELCWRLNGRGVPNLDEAYREMRFEPVLTPFRETVNAEVLRNLASNNGKAHKQFEKSIASLLGKIDEFAGNGQDTEEVMKEIHDELSALKETEFEVKKDSNERSLHHVLAGWIASRHIGRVGITENDAKHVDESGGPSPRLLARHRLEDWLLRKSMAQAYSEFSGDNAAGWFDALLVSVGVAHDNFFDPSSKLTLAESLTSILEDPLGSQYLQINRHREIDYLNKEQLERMLEALALIMEVRLHSRGIPGHDTMALARRRIKLITAAAEKSGYQVDKMITLLKK